MGPRAVGHNRLSEHRWIILALRSKAVIMNRWYLLLLNLSALAWLGCTPIGPEPSRAQRVREQCPDRWDLEYFFPAGSLAPRPALDSLARFEFSSYLQAAEGDSLSCGASAAEAYRLIRRGARPAVVFVSGSSDEWNLVAVELEARQPVAGPSGALYTRGWITTARVTLHPTDLQVRTIRSTLDRAAFWTVASLKGNVDWVIEGRVGRRYRVVSRGSWVDPVEADMRDQAFEDACRLFMSMAALPERPSP
jgi:hypothetical protein